MGRSVSFATGSVAVAYQHIEYEDEEGTPYPFAWEDIVDDVVNTATHLWPSFTPCDKWLDREDHAILENSYAYIGMSEYCGLASVWLVPKEQCGYSDDHIINNLSKGFCNKIKNRFLDTFSTLNRVATFSNGEAIFERRA
jgi:hypothetical protein